MSGDYILAVKSIGLSKIGGRKPCTLDGAAKHNKRANPRELENRGRIDATRVPLNYCLAGAGTVAGIEALAMGLMGAINTSPEKMRRDYCQAIEIVFSLPTNTTIDLRHFFTECVNWCAAQFGMGNILSADVHLDEAHPHCHVLIAPIQDGRWVGSKLIDRSNTHALRESFKAGVADRYGLRMVDKLTGKQKTDAVAIVLEDIEAHHKPLIASPLWQPLRQCIERAPAPFVAALGLALRDKAPPKRKTMAQIFTSTGKGAKRETLSLKKSKPKGFGAADSADIAEPLNPIGNEVPLPAPLAVPDDAQNNQSLSCVGFDLVRTDESPSPEPASLPKVVEDREDGYKVERDTDHPDHGDGESWGLPQSWDE